MNVIRDHILFIKLSSLRELTILLVYVDAIIVTCGNSFQMYTIKLITSFYPKT